MRAIVLDASVAVSWLLPDEETRYVELQDRSVSLHVPAHWQTEVCNSLIQARKRERVSESEFALCLSRFGQMADNVLLDTLPFLIMEVSLLAQKHGLTSYDAAYLSLALRLGMPIATLDRALANAAAKEGIDILRG